MTGTHTSAGGQLAKRERYRKVMFGVLGAGVVGSLALRLLEYPLVGEGVYWIGIIGFFAVWRGTSVSLFDERDVHVEQRASQLTMLIAAGVLVLGASGARLLSTVTDQTIPPFVEGVLYGYVGLFVVFAGVYLWVRSRT